MPNGARVWYERQGAGPTIFHIHGSGFGHRNFERLTPLLVDRLEVVDFDLPGFGDSGPAPHGGGIHEWADDVAALIRALGHERAHVHGTSLGGMIGLSLAGPAPRRRRPRRPLLLPVPLRQRGPHDADDVGRRG